jgi:hypothetical protein
LIFWTSTSVALGLVSVAVVHWLFTRRMLAVSGAFTAIVNRVRHGRSETVTWTEAELQAAIAAATFAEFDPALTADADPASSAQPLDLASSAGEQEASLADAPSALVEEPAVVGSLPPPPRSVAQHTVFLVALVLGGAVSSLLGGHYQLGFALQSETFSQLTGEHPLASVGLLLVGGTLVGAGTRMAGGCTSGHGLCGVSRFQRGSLVATMVFFATGILTALLIGSVA